MNINRRIIFVSKNVMVKLMIMVNYALFCLILSTDPDLCENCSLHDFTYLTGF